MVENLIVCTCFVSLFCAVCAFGMIGVCFCESNKSGWYSVLAFFVFCLITMACVPTVNSAIDRRVQERQEERESVRQEGHKAYHLGVPANANPYQGSRYHGTDSRLWLEGWMSAKEEDVAK